VDVTRLAAPARAVLPLPPMWRESRVPLEYAALVRDPVWRGAGVPHGDGQPVLLVCGFMAGDQSLSAMAGWLHRIGHRPQRAGLRWNVGCTGEAVDRLEARAEALVRLAGRPIAVVGQSRGGSFAKALAVRRPELIDRVVTLGTPLRDPLDVHPGVWAQIHLLGALGTLGVPGLLRASCRNGSCCARTGEELRAPLPDGVAFTSVYSRDDGIVRWRACRQDGAHHVEITASHIGMAVSAPAYRAIAAALAPAA
jgi:pimeloyl-ACP methyl ester carboxylesterase